MERMAAAETELGDLNQRVVDLTSNLNNILGSLTKLETWISTVDAGIQGLNKVVEEILARVTKLESSPATATFVAT
jgi:chromosome segregation ATPase